jgi:hypothetical protein
MLLLERCPRAANFGDYHGSTDAEHHPVTPSENPILAKVTQEAHPPGPIAQGQPCGMARPLGSWTGATRTSENFPSRTFVNKGKKEGRA